MISVMISYTYWSSGLTVAAGLLIAAAHPLSDARTENESSSALRGSPQATYTDLDRNPDPQPNEIRRLKLQQVLERLEQLQMVAPKSPPTKHDTAKNAIRNIKA